MGVDVGRPLLLGLVGLLSISGGTAGAAVVRYHFLPSQSPEQITLQPANAAGGERLRWFGTVREAYRGSLRPTHVVTFLHPYTGRKVSVPLALPEGTPLLRHTPDGITFSYGSYTVGARFLPDGSVDVTYDSGLFREP